MSTSSLKKGFRNLSATLLVLSGVASATTPNAPGPYVGVYNVNSDSARISFLDNSNDEEGFKVYLYDNTTGVLDGSISPNPIIVPKSNNKYQYVNLTNLQPDSFYEVRVSAFNGDGESATTDPSSDNNGRFNTTNPNSCIAMPDQYVGVWNVTDSGARISLKDNSDNEKGFKAYVYEYGTDNLVKTLDLPAVDGVGSYQYANITGLEENKIYEVKVSAYNDSCESATTTPSSKNNGRFRTLSAEPCPAMPSKYVGTYNVTDSSARISFLDKSNNETGFKVYVHKYGSDEVVQTITLPASDGVGKYQYANIECLCPDTIYQVSVSAYNSTCESEKTTPSSQNNGRFRTNQ